MIRMKFFQLPVTLKRSVFAVLCICVLSLLPAQTPVAQAATPEYGYLWNLYFDFNSGFDGVLTVEVGPWHDGDLLSVEETSVTPVRCEPVGTVKLDSGAASFYGDGYLQCSMNIGDVVSTKHKLKPNNPDTYGAIVMRATVALGSDGSAPLFAHPDAQFRLDPGGAMDIQNITDLSNNSGVMSAAFSNTNWSTWQTYTSNYWCVPDSYCDMDLYAAGTKIVLPQQGDPVTFATEETVFTIGKDDTGNLIGRIDALLVDPGNFVH